MSYEGFLIKIVVRSLKTQSKCTINNKSNFKRGTLNSKVYTYNVFTPHVKDNHNHKTKYKKVK